MVDQSLGLRETVSFCFSFISRLPPTLHPAPRKALDLTLYSILTLAEHRGRDTWLSRIHMTTLHVWGALCSMCQSRSGQPGQPQMFLLRWTSFPFIKILPLACPLDPVVEYSASTFSEAPRTARCLLQRHFLCFCSAIALSVDELAPYSINLQQEVAVLQRRRALILYRNRRGPFWQAMDKGAQTWTLCTGWGYYGLLVLTCASDPRVSLILCADAINQWGPSHACLSMSLSVDCFSLFNNSPLPLRWGDHSSFQLCMLSLLFTMRGPSIFWKSVTAVGHSKVHIIGTFP